MTITVLTLPALKKVKNSVIGNPSAKLLIAKDDGFIRVLVETLNHSTTEPLRIEAAHVIASLAYGSEPALAALLQHQAVHALLYALAVVLSPPSLTHTYTHTHTHTHSHTHTHAHTHTYTHIHTLSPSSSSTLPPAPSQTLISALARALRAVVAALADVVGPAQYGLPPVVSGIRGMAEDVLETVFCQESLDVYLPLLAPLPSGQGQGQGQGRTQARTQSQIAIAHLLGAALRSAAHRTAVAAWIPPALRPAPVTPSGDASRAGTSRGWEGTGTSPVMSRSPDVRMGRAVEVPAGRSAGRGWESAGGRSFDHGTGTGTGTKPGRGWEKAGTTGVKDGGWVARALVGMITGKDVKAQEAALLALAALVKDSPDLASVLERPLIPISVPAPAPLTIHAPPSSGSGSAYPTPGSYTSMNTGGTSTGAGASLGLSVSTSRSAWDRAPGGSTSTSVGAGTGGSGNGHGGHGHAGAGAGAGAGNLDYAGTPLGVVLALTKARAVDLKVSACLCAARIRRATPSSSSSFSSSPPATMTPSLVPAQMVGPAEDVCARTVINVVNLMIAGDGVGVGGVVGGGAGGVGSTGEAMAVKVKACFILLRTVLWCGGNLSLGLGVWVMINSLLGSERFGIDHLITDDPALCQTAFDHGSLERLATLVRALIPLPAPTPPGNGATGASSLVGATTLGTSGGMGMGAGTGVGGAGGGAEGESQGWEEDEEPESVCALREAALTATAALSLFSNDIRRAVTDDFGLLPRVQAALGARHAGTRYAACQCVRALSRAVAVLRTNIVDSGLGMAVFGVLGEELGEGAGAGAGAGTGTGVGVGAGRGPKEKGKEVDMDGEGERRVGDRRVLGAALSAVCNIVNDFSPLRPIFLEKGLMPRLMKILGMGEPTLKLSALWAIKNLLRKSSVETKKDVMRSLGWDQLIRYLSDKDEGVQEQAYNVVKNLAENEEGVSMVFTEIGPQVLLQHLTISLKSTNENVVREAAFVLANLSNGCESEQQDILFHPHLLDALRSCLAVSKTETRRPIVACILALASGNPKRRKEIVDAGFVSTLRHLCEWSGVAAGGGGGGGGGGSPGVRRATVLEDDRDVVDRARVALDWLEHGDTYVIS
ncbi:hypothetical protein BDZ94DRAFT_1300951 [Collybia nuda]|uniref:Armadillo repeat-containing protein 8 n=1 Tax=Collybia nuda TaxID=64659 RepID=A0A9P5XW63_9AGAR|nr:hypothetical protein BDZ94DRAFT_1300951 [Collybia nuda]